MVFFTKQGSKGWVGERGGLVCLVLWGFGGDFVIGICFGRGRLWCGNTMDMTKKSIGNERMFNSGTIA